MLARMKPSALLALTLPASAMALTPAQWRNQSVYQVLTDRFALTDGSTSSPCDLNSYCGGTFQGIINRLDYIRGMGFTAIWISPVVSNLVGETGDGSGYHGYWAQDIYSINPNFGSASDLVALSDALHDAGMYLMVDIVTNHMGYEGCGACVDYSIFNPFDSDSYYHPYCAIDYGSTDITEIQDCWEGDGIVSLPDLATEDSDVLDMWNSWIAELVSNYTIDAGVYIVGEVDDGDPDVVCPYQNDYSLNPLNYPAYYWITQAFQSTSGSIGNLVSGVDTIKSGCADSTLLGSFMENHDNPRFPSYTSDYSLAGNAIAFTMLADGIPIIYEGQEQHFSGASVPGNREAVWSSGYDTTAQLYTLITALNAIRSWAVSQSSSYVTYKAYPTYSDSSTIVMRKGAAGSQVIAVFSNLGADGASYTLTLTSGETGFTDGQSLVEVLACRLYTTDSSGNLAAAMSGGVPLVFYPAASLDGSGICPDITGPGSSSSSSTTTTTTESAASTAATHTSSSSASSLSSATAGGACTDTVPVRFYEAVTTTYGQTIKLSGNQDALGNWDPSDAIALSAAEYTSSDHLWYVSVNLTPGSVVEYKYINVAGNGDVTWEADPDHTYTVPTTWATQATVSNTWQT
ncbi:alpha-amylase [Geosmithia morbida]|uniref:alpha-amylase n=1 Tax=Geosmithia morbida TaxID=1094350 RepID=A0A9P4YZ26_9HYPO|nr:alpha-amylase [Geosmithia morbida]KAF4125157.1 alpha-amylase [Geosmithia morbida]